MPPSSATHAAPVRRKATDDPQRLPIKDADDAVWSILKDAGLWDEIGFLMRLAQLALLDYAAPKVKRFGLSIGTVTILRVIRARPGLTQQRIADTLRINKANLTPVIQELVADGFVSRKNSGSNKRAYALFLTAKGRRAFEGADAAIFGEWCAAPDNLTDEERQKLVRLLRKIVRGPGTS